MSESLVMLDTCTVSEGTKARPKLGFSEWMNDHPNVAIPFPVWTELAHGISLLTENPIKKAQLQIWLDRLRASEYVLPELNMEVAVIYGEMMACRPLQHFWMTVPSKKKVHVKSDLLIAAIAIAHDLPLATYDLEDFGKIDSYFKMPGLIYPGCRAAELGRSTSAVSSASTSDWRTRADAVTGETTNLTLAGPTFR